jgi:3-phenylpropionate/trans-cinnamate dioxygenase ferredoxin reductase subunit
MDLRLGVPAERLATEHRRTLADGSSVPYDVLVIPTGAGARSAPLAGAIGAARAAQP